MLTLTGCAVGLGCAAVTGWAVTRGLSRYRHTPGPADVVTLFRASLVCGLAALVADSFLRPPAVGAVTVLAVVPHGAARSYGPKAPPGPPSTSSGAGQHDLSSRSQPVVPGLPGVVLVVALLPHLPVDPLLDIARNEPGHEQPAHPDDEQRHANRDPGDRPVEQPPLHRRERLL